MTTTPDNTATSWRSLSDQLTTQQIERLTEMETRQHPDVPDVPAEALLFGAREYAEQNLLDTPLPAGARDGSGWEKNLQRDGWSRALLWASFGDAEMSVDIDGAQESDGTYTRQISVWLAKEGASLTSEGARRLAGLLVEAADELEQLRPT